MTLLYELAVLGMPPPAAEAALRQEVAAMLKAFELELGRDVGWHVHPTQFVPDQQRCSAAVFFGAPAAKALDVSAVLKAGIPVLPLASTVKSFGAEIPAALGALNGMGLDKVDLTRVAATLLECCGLMPRQRRIFLSYRRDEATPAALQLFDVLSARQFDVFLDTHGVPPATDFQAVLWHRLCDADVLLMLDTASYFESRWTSAEFGRALAKNISVLRVGWPDATPSTRTKTASRVELVSSEIDSATGRLADSAIERICDQVERVRSQSQAVRRLNLVSNVRIGIEQIQGTFVGLGRHGAVHIELPDGHPVTVFPTLGVPTSTNLHQASVLCAGEPPAVVYDEVGLLPECQEHLDWLGEHVKSARWVKASQLPWTFADWEVS